MIVKWNGNELFRDIKRDLGNNLDVAAKLYQTRLRRSINKKVVRLYRKRTGGTSLIRGRGRNTAYIQRSKPGEPPRRDTGKLWRSIRRRTQRAKLISTISSNIEYAADLEFGNARMLARPSWRPTFEQSYRTMIKIITGRRGI